LAQERPAGSAGILGERVGSLTHPRAGCVTAAAGALVAVFFAAEEAAGLAVCAAIGSAAMVRARMESGKMVFMSLPNLHNLDKMWG
jgi:hypothetical protein